MRHSYFLFLLLFLPLATAFDCNTDVCNNIKNSELNSSMKNLLISNLIYEGGYTPDHEFIRNYNLDQDYVFSGSKKNSKYIKNAWLIQTSIMPSVLYNNSLYVPENVEVLNKYDYDIYIPPDFTSSKKKNKTICRRDYSLSTADSRLYVNSIQCNSELCESSIKKDSAIESKLVIYAKIKEKQYRWRKYCSRRIDGDCVKWRYKCKYYTTKYHTDSLELTDSQEVKLYSNNLDSSIDIKDIYPNSVKLNINTNNSLILESDKSRYQYNKYYYDVSYKYDPYLIIRANKVNTEISNNILKHNNTLFFPKSTQCEIIEWDFFNTTSKLCNLNLTKPGFIISTDKLIYKPGDLILVDIYPKNEEVIIVYNNQSYSAINELVLIANNSNKISIIYQEFSKDYIIQVNSREYFSLIVNIIIFIVINYYIYLAIKSCLGKISTHI